MLRALPTWISDIPLATWLDWGIVTALMGAALYLTRRSRAVWLVRGYLLLLLLSSLSTPFPLLRQVLSTLLLGAAVALALLFQPELRRFLEALGRGEWLNLLTELLDDENPQRVDRDTLARLKDELVPAVQDLAKNRIGALIIIERSPLEPEVFKERGVPINGILSQEILQTIFQTSTLLHDGAVVIRNDRIVTAGTLLPISEKPAVRQLGTRHRAAMGITEITDCLCVVVSEETGSISLAINGSLMRISQGTSLNALLEDHLRPATLATIASEAPTVRQRLFSLLRATLLRQ
ncbi:MAG: TIGR00159 family protein, partial [Synechococcaceae cyanobacterium SM2_3_60]|nr:TIGR00159 family protein [Synechococcaceae cyanobacterium SM2_3_60]